VNGAGVERAYAAWRRKASRVRPSRRLPFAVVRLADVLTWREQHPGATETEREEALLAPAHVLRRSHPVPSGARVVAITHVGGEGEPLVIVEFEALAPRLFELEEAGSA
jgi:hypothetical protein